MELLSGFMCALPTRPVYPIARIHEHSRHYWILPHLVFQVHPQRGQKEIPLLASDDFGLERFLNTRYIQQEGGLSYLLAND